MTLTINTEVYQGTPEWFALRCGMLTASAMCKIISPAQLKYAENVTARAHFYEILAQRITQYIEPAYEGFNILRGHEDEIDARGLYDRHIAPVNEVGFITNDKWGFMIGYSPDGLVGDDGLIETKSRVQKYQTEAILKNEVPTEFMLQLQTGLLVSERKWIDFISYSAGMPMFIKRVLPDETMQTAIVEAAGQFYGRIDDALIEFAKRIGDMKLIPTIRRATEIVS